MPPEQQWGPQGQSLNLLGHEKLARINRDGDGTGIGLEQ